MLSRRFIRIKVFKLLFSCVHSQSMDIASAEKELLKSFDKTRQLYFLLLSLPEALKKYAQERIDIGLQKYQPSEEELSPNLRFVNNKAIEVLYRDKELSFSQEHGLNWTQQRAFIKKIYEEIREEPYFIEYMNASEAPDFKKDVNLLKDIFCSELDDNPDLYNILEDQNIYWADDVAYVCNIIIAQLSLLKPSSDHMKHPDLFKKEDDREFALQLFMQALTHYNEYVSYVERFADNWDLERIAATDTAIIVMGVAEAVKFPGIPVKVTLNEMVEISKFYSTGNSRIFVNGVLDKIIKYLMESGEIVKKGRGLVDNKTESQED